MTLIPSTLARLLILKEELNRPWRDALAPYGGNGPQGAVGDFDSMDVRFFCGRLIAWGSYLRARVDDRLVYFAKSVLSQRMHGLATYREDRAALGSVP